MKLIKVDTTCVCVCVCINVYSTSTIYGQCVFIKYFRTTNTKYFELCVVVVFLRSKRNGQPSSFPMRARSYTRSTQLWRWDECQTQQVSGQSLASKYKSEENDDDGPQNVRLHNSQRFRMDYHR